MAKIDEHDVSEILSVCKNCDWVFRRSFLMASVNPYDAAVEVADALKKHRATCPKAK